MLQVLDKYKIDFTVYAKELYQTKGRLFRFDIPEGNVLADSISYLPHFAAWNKLFMYWFAQKDYSQLLMYIIDIADADTLPLLAWQLDVLGYKGWKLCKTDADRRALIKKAIELHRYKGSVWAVKESLKSIGFVDAVLTEHVDGNWAKFRITIDLGTRPLDAAEIADITGIIAVYKNVRSHLADILYTISFSEVIAATDSAFIEPGQNPKDKVYVGKVRFCDGSYLNNGSIDCSKDEDVVIWTVI